MKIFMHLATYWLSVNLVVISYLLVAYFRHRLVERLSTNQRRKIAIVGGFLAGQRRN